MLLPLRRNRAFAGTIIIDILLVWSFDTYEEWAKDPGPKAEYEKQNGQGSWQRMMDEWMDIVSDYNSYIRTNIR